MNALTAVVKLIEQTDLEEDGEEAPAPLCSVDSLNTNDVVSQISTHGRQPSSPTFQTSLATPAALLATPLRQSPDSSPRSGPPRLPIGKGVVGAGRGGKAGERNFPLPVPKTPPRAAVPLVFADIPSVKGMEGDAGGAIARLNQRISRLTKSLAEERETTLHLQAEFGDYRTQALRSSQEAAMQRALACRAKERLGAKQEELVSCLGALVQARKRVSVLLRAKEGVAQAELEDSRKDEEDAEGWASMAGAESEEHVSGGQVGSELQVVAEHLRQQLHELEVEMQQTRRDRDMEEHLRKNTELAFAEHKSDAETAAAQLARAAAGVGGGEELAMPAVADARLQARCERLEKELAERHRAVDVLRDENADLRSRLDAESQRNSAASLPYSEAPLAVEQGLLRAVAGRGRIGVRVRDAAGRLDFIALRLGRFLRSHALVRVVALIYLALLQTWAFMMLCSAFSRTSRGVGHHNLHQHERGVP
eukprot:Hpha_TRINITY_DN19073_c0_g1::TRINITY_DN19073_c0_g1_i1::g.138373::m.138373